VVKLRSAKLRRAKQRRAREQSDFNLPLGWNGRLAARMI
jgi:hypothetical protein